MVQGRHHHTLLKQIQLLIGNKLNVYQTLDKIPKILHVSRKQFALSWEQFVTSLRCRGNSLCCRGSGLSFCKIMIQAQFRDKSDNKKTHSKAMNCMF